MDLWEQRFELLNTAQRLIEILNVTPSDSPYYEPLSKAIANIHSAHSELFDNVLYALLVIN